MRPEKMISIIVPCLNHYQVTKRCIESIAHHTRNKYELIIVDDGSSDETQEELSKIYPVGYGTIQIRHNTNLGFSKSVNDGINAAKGKLIAVFNNDMIVSKDWLKPLIAALDTDKMLGMISSTLIEPDMCNADEFIDYIAKLPKPDKPIEYWSKGGPWLFRAEVLKDIGAFDENFLHTTYEDWDYLIRMALKGYKHGKALDSFVYHFSRLTQKGELKKRAGAVDYQAINKEYFYKKWGTVEPNYAKIYEDRSI